MERFHKPAYWFVNGFTLSRSLLILGSAAAYFHHDLNIVQAMIPQFISIAADTVDGTIARKNNVSSREGMYLDAVADSLFFSVPFGLYLHEYADVNTVSILGLTGIGFLGCLYFFLNSPRNKERIHGHES